MNADPQTALAIAVVPFGVEAKVEDTLFQMMAGACTVLAEAGCSLVGGHTCEGAELSLGFSINGLAQWPDQGMTKGGKAVKATDMLILTKPIGTGTIFAADMRGEARGTWVAEALKGMCQSNHKAAQLLQQHGASSCTDVTGFGLLGHLVEMASASHAPPPPPPSLLLPLPVSLLYTHSLPP
jgi:selenide,water dikinase